MDLRRTLARASGREPADLLLRNLLLADVFSGEVYPTELALAEGVIVGVGPGYRARDVRDLGGRYVCPGLIDAHVHVESSSVLPGEFGRALACRGVTAAVTNPHEIANVLGREGVRFMLAEGSGSPTALFVMVPSCVPATGLATSGASLSPEETGALLAEPRVLGLGEVMDYAGVVSGSPRVLEELRLARGRVVDGHCPGLSGPPLNAYVAAGIGSEHECTGVEEAREKLQAGMTILVREGTSARNLDALLPLARQGAERRLCFCTDDRQPSDLLDLGSVDDLVRRAVAQGIEPLSALRMATLNPAEHYGLKDRGALGPGRRADLVVCSDLRSPRAEEVYVGGRLVASAGGLVGEAPPARPIPAPFRETIRLAPGPLDFGIPASGARCRVVGIVPGQIATEHLVLDVPRAKGRAVADPERDVLKLAVLERHRGSGRRGLGFVRGLGLRRGALASTVAHDHHNLIVAGADDRSMETAARAVAETGGGLAAALEETLLARLELPVAGLMSDRDLGTVRTARDRLLTAARELGSPLRDPFMTLSFLALEVIPSLKLTDLGLVDTETFRLVPLFV